MNKRPHCNEQKNEVYQEPEDTPLQVFKVKVGEETVQNQWQPKSEDGIQINDQQEINHSPLCLEIYDLLTQEDLNRERMEQDLDFDKIFEEQSNFTHPYPLEKFLQWNSPDKDLTDHVLP
ncbi:hypothetical protein E2320_014254 [Naja naja]|nr:hypothetical protein E2320_014254 [Naja naja]